MCVTSPFARHSPFEFVAESARRESGDLPQFSRGHATDGIEFAIGIGSNAFRPGN